jgi:hypothetical protein
MPKEHYLGNDFIKLMVDEMPIIPIMSFNVSRPTIPASGPGPDSRVQPVREHRDQLVQFEVHSDPVEAAGN